MSEKYIAVEGHLPSIIKRCDDRACDKWHTWVTLSAGRYYEAAQIAKAMNALDTPRVIVLSHDEIETALRRVPDTDLTMAGYDALARAVGVAMDAAAGRTSMDVGNGGK